jgi:hypothetical protein
MAMHWKARHDQFVRLLCQSGVWAMQSGGVVSNYKFEVLGYVGMNYWSNGIGVYSASTGKFSGSMICDPLVKGSSCGNAGYQWYGTDAGNALNYSSCNSSTQCKTVGVSTISVVNVTKIW